jgi:phosphoglycerate kinase
MVRGIKTVDELKIEGKAVLVRGDLDVEDGENPRVNSVRNIVKTLVCRDAKRVKVIGHRETKYPICDQLRSEFPGVEFDDGLRLDPGEKANSEEFARRLAERWDVYINEAFATSHRKHTSFDTLPRHMKSEGKEVGLGMRFVVEMEKLDRVKELLKSGCKSVLVIGGVKIEDKEKFTQTMKDKFSAVLKGGLLPGVRLRPDGLDISDEAIEEYERVISGAELVLAAGVMGKYEEEGSSKGTKTTLEAIANSTAYKVAGGGDIEMAISTYGLTEKFDWISVGGGAMLEYLAMGTLPGIEALIE